MNTMNNILSKIFLLLVLALGWGGSAWAQTIETGIYKIACSIDDRGFMIDNGTNGTTLSKNKYNTGVYTATATNDNALWYFVKNSDGSYYIASLSSQQTAAPKFLTRINDNFAGYSDVAVKWNVSFKGQNHRGSNNGQYAPTQVSDNFDYFELQPQGQSKFLLSAPGNGSNPVRFGTTEVNGTYWEFQNVAESVLSTAQATLLKAIKAAVPTTFQASDAPSGGKWAANTHWFTMRNERANSYMSTASAYYDTNGLKLRLSTNPTETSGFWCFVSDGAGKYYIYNYDAGPNKVLGTAYNGSDGNARTKMYEGTTTESGVGKHYEIGESSGGYWLRSTGPDGTNNWFIDGPTSGTYFTVWNHATNPKTSNGNRFFLYEAEVPYYEIPSSDYSFNPATGRIPTCQDFQLTLSAGSKTIVSCTELIAEGTNVPSVMPILVSRARASITASSVTKVSAGVYTIHFDENIDDGDYTLEVPAGVFYVKDGDNVQKIATLSIDYQIVPPGATSGYKVIIKQADDDTNTYTVSTTEAVTTGRQYAYNNEFLDLTTDPNLKDLQSLTIDAPANKFVWGPVVDNTEKTITFEVRTAINSLAELTDGFYQLQMTDQDNITRYNTIAKDFNTKSKYVYAAPWYTQSEYKNDYANKYTGVPSYAGAPSTFYYLSKSGSNVRVQSIYGHYFTRLNTPNREPQNITSIEYNTTNNTLSFDGWTKENYWNSNNSTGTEGPRAAAASGKMEHYHVSKVDLSDYDVYRVVIEGWAAGANIQSDPRVTYRGAEGNNLGLPTVYQNGYFFFKKGYKPVLADFNVEGKTYSNPAVYVTGSGDIKDLTFCEKRVELGEVNIRIVNESNADLPDARVIYTPVVGDPATLTANTTYNFNNALFNSSLFSAVGIYSIVSATLDEETHTITFVLKNDPNLLQFSSAPSGAEWAADTKWFTWRSNRNNISAEWQFKYLTTSAQGMHEDCTMYTHDLDRNVPPTDRGGLWCFVGDINKFRIQNAAYGPEFCFVRLSNGKYTMARIGEIPSGAQEWFSAPATSNVLEGATIAYQLRIGTTGNTYLHINNSDMTTYSQNNTDSGNSFRFDYVDGINPSWPAYDIYKIMGAGIAYNGNRAFGRRENSPYLMVEKGADVTKEEAYGLYANLVKDFAVGSLDGSAYIKTISATKVDNTKDYYRTIILGGVPNDFAKMSGDGTWIKLASREGYFELPAGGAFNQANLKAVDAEGNQVSLAYTITTVSQNDGLFAATYKVRFPGFVLHRPHAVYTHREEFTGDNAPSDKFVKLGDGLMPHPNAAKLEGGSYIDNDRIMQNTSVFHITQYTTRGGTTEVRMPYRRERDGALKNQQYQRWYDYSTERLLPEGVVNLSGATLYGNGQVKTGNANLIGKTNIKLPADSEQIIVGVDASEFEDYSTDADGNLIEPSLSMRVLITVKDAAVMVANMQTEGGSKWFEEKTYIVPNIKRGSNNYRNNVDLLPLDMPFTNYWIDNGDGVPMRIVAENGSYDILDANTDVEVEGTAKDYITADIFKNNDHGIGAPPPVATNHFIYYKVDKDGDRTVPAGSQAIIKVYAKNSELGESAPRYQIAKFTLTFQADTEPLAITSVIGNENSTRSREYFKRNGMEEVASLTFQEKQIDFRAIKSGTVQPYTYAFPIEPRNTSYSYSPNDAFGGYRITKKGYGMKALPVSVYEHNILNQDAAYSVAGQTVSEVPDDYYLYIDASEAPGQVASIPLDGNLCRGSKLYFYGWLNSQNPIEYDATSASVILELIGKKGGNETVLARYAPGIISDVAYTPSGELVRSVKDGKTASNLGAYSYSYNINGHGDDQARIAAWQSIGFSYTLTESDFQGFELRVLNNCFSTVGGDYSLDDFRVFVKTPQIRVDNAAPICGNELSIVRISTDFDALMSSLQGNSLDESMTYYGTYAILDKEVYDKHLASIETPSTADVKEAFNKALMGSTDKENDCTIDGVFFPELYAFHNIKFYSKYDKNPETTYSMLVSDKILSEAGSMIERSENNEIMSRKLVFNCRVNDTRIAGKKYYLVFHASPTDDDMTTVGDYAQYFSMGDVCCVLSEFSALRAQMVNIEGSEELDPYRIDYCPGTAPTIGINSYGYNVHGELIQEKDVYYDWYMGTMEAFRKEVIPLSGAQNSGSIVATDGHTNEDFCMYHSLLNFRHFYPNASVKELNDGTVVEKSYSIDPESGVGYELTAGMISKLKEWTAADKLRLHLTGVSVDLSATDEQKMTYVVAIQQGEKKRYAPEDTEKQFPILYCMEPVEISFHTNLEAPSTSVGMSGIDYSPSPYDRDKTEKMVLHSLPVRVNMAQIRNINATEEGVQLRLPLRVINPSGYYKEDDSEGIPQPTQKIHLSVDEFDSDIVVAETNDPLWQMRKVDEGGGEYLPVVGRLRKIDANKRRKEGVDYLWLDFSNETIDKNLKFLPREGYYYILRTPFVENINDDAVISSKYEVPKIKCKGHILIPVKIVPEYMVWTGAESSDWNNDRNWRRADYREVVPSEAQNLNDPYNWYRSNLAGGDCGSQVPEIYGDNLANGLPKSLNETPDLAEKDKDIYIPMDLGSTPSVDNVFAYAPMHETSVIIPSNCERYPVLVRHGLSTATGSNGLLNLSTDPSVEKNTPWIVQDMVARLESNPNASGKKQVYGVVPYYENDIKDITFQPGARMMGTEYLNYEKAWVEYALDVNRWYTLASPLQDTYSGEWYAPTGIDADNSAKQLTPYFYDITYSAEKNDRFRPAIYQRSWDKYNDKANVYLKDGGEAYAYLTGDWSYVYNDVLQKYGTGGFSVKVSDEHMTFKPSNGKSIIRMPKADAEYTYYDMDKQEGQKADDALPEVSHRYRLWTDAMTAPAPDQDLELQQTITNAVATNNYFLVGNPFMANLDMEKFFEANADQLEKVYWVVSAEDGQTVSVRSAYDQKNNSTVDDDQRWVVTDSEGKFGADYAVVAPLQGFFVKAKNSVNSVTLKYTAGMQTLKITTLSMLRQPEHPSPIDPESEAADTDESIDEGPTYTIEGKRIPVSAFGKGVVISRGKKVLRN